MSKLASATRLLRKRRRDSSDHGGFIGGDEMKFVCMGFIEESKYESMSEGDGQRMMEECFAYDDELRRGGHFLGGEALQSAKNAVTLRMKNGSVDVTDGPYAETKEMLGGILLLEARDLNHAIALMSRHPGVKAGPFEIRPANVETNKLIADRDAALASGVAIDKSQASPCSALRMALNFSYEWIKPLAEDLADSPMTVRWAMCPRDEGRSLVTGLRRQVANHRKRLWSKAIGRERYGKGGARPRQV
jgi:hypothetical protein